MSNQAKPLLVLHLDDDPFQLDRVRFALEQNPDIQPFEVISVETAEELLKCLKNPHQPAIVLLDIHIDARSDGGIILARKVRDLCPEAAIFMCSNADDAKTITRCLQSGADDFISKDSDRGELSLRVWNSYQLTRAKRGLLIQNAHAPNVKSIACKGRTFAGIASRLPRILNSAISAIHVSGESGVGKEMVADLLAVHLQPNAPFIKVNCGAIVPTLLESELFGHLKGSFTGAVSDRRGYLEAASGGWIFLDEVATLSASAQIALLRTIENQEITPVGATKATRVKVRLISATNEPLERLVARGDFRRDLWQRLCETEIHIPPLRERREEIPDLIEHFLANMAGGPYKITKAALDILSNVPWAEGNVRELRNCLRAMTEFHIDKLLTPLGIPERVLRADPRAHDLDMAQGSGANVGPACGNNTVARDGDVGSLPTLRLSVECPVVGLIHFDDLEDKLLLELLRARARTDGKKSLRSVAKDIGIARSTLSERARRLVAKGCVSMDEIGALLNVTD